jgi:serine/threonine-protein kinase
MGELSRGTILQDRYRIVDLRAEGGTASVYLATRLGMDEEVRLAVKQFPAGTVPPIEFLNEVRVLFRLSHPNLPKVYDFFQEGGHYFLVTDFVDGQTLADLVQARGGSLEEEEVIEHGLAICAIFRYLHETPERVVHRDLKPGNLMLDADGRLKLIDFGIARVLHGDGSARGVHGFTESFSSPEQRLNLPTDERSDIYSFGGTLYYLLRGVPPEQEFRRTLGGTRRQVVSRGLQRIVRRCLEAEPEARYPSFAELERDLQAYSRLRRATLGRRLKAGVGLAVVVSLALLARWVLAPAEFPLIGDSHALPGSRVAIHLALPPARLAATEPRLQWIIHDRQLPGEPVATFQGRAGISFEPPRPGIYRVEVRDGNRRVSEVRELVVYQVVSVSAEVLLGQSAKLEVRPQVPESPGRSHHWRWSIVDPLGQTVERITDVPWLEYRFPSAGRYRVNLAVLVRVEGAFDVMVTSPPDAARLVEVVPYHIPRPEWIVNRSEFETAERGWPVNWTLVGRGVIHDPGEGRGGPGSVRLTDVLDERTYAITTLPAEGGRRYRVTVWTRGRGVAPPGQQVLEVQFRSMVDDRFVLPPQRVTHTRSADFPWGQMALEFTLPDGVAANLELYLKTLGRGTIWFDDFVVEVLDG